MMHAGPGLSRSAAPNAIEVIQMFNPVMRMFLTAGLVAGTCGPAGARQGEPAQQPPAAAQAGATSAEHPVSPIAHVEKRGDGPIPMILIPGVASEWNVWDGFMTRNAQRYTMHAITLPGFGGSAPPELGDKDTYETLAVTRNADRAILKYLAECGLEKPVLVGHGYGAMLALRVALNHPELVRAVVSVDGMPVIPMADPNRDLDMAARRENIRNTMLKSFVKMTEDEWKNQQYMNALALVSDDRRARELGEMFNRTDRSVAFHYYLESLLVDMRPQMSTLAVPTMFIAPMAPIGVPNKVQRQQWRAALGAPPNTTLKFYTDCRHFVMDDFPDQLDADTDLFLRGQGVPDSFKSFEPEADAAPAEPANGLPRRPPTGRDPE
jgi:pimeloyl-ACP methyl ester carboxylesterase